jgi:hypothetical protein
VKDTDIDDFLAKADAVQKAIKGMTDGTLKPEDVHVEGIKSQKELEAEEVCVIILLCLYVIIPVYSHAILFLVVGVYATVG